MSIDQKVTLFALALALGPCTAWAETADAVRYEAFGAVGGGAHDDLPAICRAHEHANARGLPVRSDPEATYHLGRKALTAVIATDTDWSNSRFTIDDSSEVENHKQALFEVRSLLPPATLTIESPARDQKRLEVRPEQACYVAVRHDKIKRFIRRGLNQNAGTSQRDCFILHRDGSIEGAIDWDYDLISRVDAFPISLRNDGQHDFGYDCFMPREVTIDGLHVDDSNHPENYEGLLLFADPGFTQESECPFPYVLSRSVSIRGLTTASGIKPRISPNARVAEKVAVVWEERTVPQLPVPGPHPSQR